MKKVLIAAAGVALLGLVPPSDNGHCPRRRRGLPPGRRCLWRSSNRIHRCSLSKASLASCSRRCRSVSETDSFDIW